MRFSFVALLSLAGLAVALSATRAECESNAWEKIHEGHDHNINTGNVGSAHLGLKLPGGSGCYKGQKVGGDAPGAPAPEMGKGKSAVGAPA